MHPSENAPPTTGTVWMEALSIWEYDAPIDAVRPCLEETKKPKKSKCQKILIRSYTFIVFVDDELDTCTKKSLSKQLTTPVNPFLVV